MAERRQALLIACEEFVDPQYKHLVVPIRDARKFAKVLQNPEIGQFSVELLENATRDVITDKLEEFFEKGRPEDVLLLYFAGHGDLDDRRNLYFVAHDTRSKRLRGSGIADRFIHETMVRSLSKKQILILDCCFSGAFSKDWISDWNPRSDASVGIKQKLTGEGRVVLTAADALEYAYEKGSPTGEVKSLFSSRLIEGIEGGYADLDGDGFISLDELYGYVEERIRQEDPSQKPQKLGQVHGQLWIGRTVPRPDAIPRKVLDLLNHNYPTVRLAGIDELERLLIVAKDVLYPAASQALTKLLSDGDEAVQRVAASALRRLEAERLESEEKKRLEAERQQKEQQDRLEAEHRETQAKERLEAERRQKEQQDRLEAEHRETQAKQQDRLEAEQQDKERLEHESQAQPPIPVVPSTPAAKPEADKPSAQTPKVVYPLPPKPAEPEREKPPPSSSDGTKGKSQSKQVIAILAIAAVLVVGGLIYLANRPSQSPPPQPAPVAAVTPSPPVIATPTVEEKVPPTPEVVVQASAQPTAPVAVENVTIPIIVKDKSSFFWQIVLAGARKAGKDLNVNVPELGAQSQSDINGQISILENAVSRKPAAIVIAPAQFAAMGKPIDEAAKKVKIIGIDSVADSTAFTSFLQTDNVQAGRVAADGLAAAITAKYGQAEGDVALITSLPGVGSLDRRDKGFKEQIAAKYPGLKLVADKVADGQAKTGLNIMTDLITAEPNLRGVFASNLIMTQGAGQAIAENNAGDKIKLVGFDSDDKVDKLLADGTIAALVVQDPFRMGYDAIKIAFAASNGEKVEAFVDSGVNLITTENMNTPRSQELLNPNVK